MQKLGVKLIDLPAYSPNLNLLERIWKFFKKKMLYKRHYTEFIDLVAASRKFFENTGYCKDENENTVLPG